MRFSNTWFEAESEAEEYRTAVKAPSMEGGAA
jgi:hypothetical protein